MSRVLSSSVSSAVWTSRIAKPLACHSALLRSLRFRFFWVIARVLKKVWTYPLWDAQFKGSFLKKKTTRRSFFEALRFGCTFLELFVLEQDRTKNTILGYTGASGPETYEIFKWKSQNLRTNYALIPASSIVRVLRATPFKAKEIAAGEAGEKNEEEVFLINYLV